MHWLGMGVMILDFGVIQVVVFVQTSLVQREKLSLNTATL